MWQQLVQLLCFHYLNSRKYSLHISLKCCIQSKKLQEDSSHLILPCCSSFLQHSMVGFGLVYFAEGLSQHSGLQPRGNAVPLDHDLLQQVICNRNLARVETSFSLFCIFLQSQRFMNQGYLLRGMGVLPWGELMQRETSLLGLCKNLTDFLNKSPGQHARSCAWKPLLTQEKGVLVAGTRRLTQAYASVSTPWFLGPLMGSARH